MDEAKFEDEMRALAVCVKCLDESKPKASLKWCTGCRMVLYCSAEHQRGHWPEHKAFCKARKKAAAAFPAGRAGWVPPLPSPRGGVSVGKKECEMFVSVCDATGVFSVLGLFWEENEKDKASSTSRLCNLVVHLGKGPVACLETKLQDWEPRTRLAALKTLTVQGSSDFVRITPAIAAALARRALEDAHVSWRGGGKRAGKHDVAAAPFLEHGEEGQGLETSGLQAYLASEAHASFKKTLLRCYDGGKTLDVLFFGLLNERREFRDCYSFLEDMVRLGGAESFDDALRKLADQGSGEKGRSGADGRGARGIETAGQATARLCEHACLCFHLAGLPGVASAMHIAKEGCEQDFASSPFVRAMLYRTAYLNARGEAVPSPKPELSERYKDLVLKPLQEAQEATGHPLAQLTPVSVEIKSLLEQEILL